LRRTEANQFLEELEGLLLRETIEEPDEGDLIGKAKPVMRAPTLAELYEIFLSKCALTGNLRSRCFSILWRIIELREPIKTLQQRRKKRPKGLNRFGTWGRAGDLELGFSTSGPKGPPGVFSNDVERVL